MYNRVAKQLEAYAQRGLNSTADFPKIVRKAVDEIYRLEHQMKLVEDDIKRKDFNTLCGYLGRDMALLKEKMDRLQCSLDALASEKTDGDDAHD